MGYLRWGAETAWLAVRVSPRKATATGVRFLAHEDTALKAYYQTRSRYLGDLSQQRAFNQIGEVLPTVIIDGTVPGTWSWNTRTAAIDTNLILGKVPPVICRQVKARADALTETLRSAWTPRARPAAKVTTPGRSRRAHEVSTAWSH
jgi:hypothetical protein